MRKESKFKVNIPKEILIQKYCNELKSSFQIATELGLSTYIVWMRLKEYKLLRTLSEAIKVVHKKGIKHKNNCQCCICKRSALKGKNHPSFGKHRSKQTKLKMRIAKLGKKRPPMLEIQKKKLSLAHGGTGIPYENNGYNADFNNSLKELIRNRDSRKCQICGCSEVECNRKLDIHHIDYNKENLNPKNLISSCHTCHMKTNNNREYWTEYFQAKVRNL